MSATRESYVFFELAGGVYAIASQSVQHIEMYEQVTLVPNANPAIDGVVYSRGQVIPALNLRRRFGFPKQEKTPRSRIIFVRANERTVGLIVDSAREFQNLPVESIRPIEEALTGINGKYLKAVAKAGERLVLILDLEAVLNVATARSPLEQESIGIEGNAPGHGASPGERTGAAGSSDSAATHAS
ncbi:MAG TPA: chemotaxis protein CheW [Verrucomicrobiae bacterium]|nr:chemotaxis protein CheW [Verrucomicrobiae bacterium]